MSKVAFVFPGQGAHKVGMGREAFEQDGPGREVFEEADRVLDFALTKLCFEGPDEELQLTQNAQPAILTTSIALLRGLAARCDAAAGHSLGEYSAHVAASTIPFEQAVRLVRERGRYMQEAVPVGRGSMAAVLGGDAAMVEQACAEVDGSVEPVNYNCPGQLVIAGEKEAVDRACERIREAGAKVRPLKVSAPFHSSLMKPAEQRFGPHLERAGFQDPSVPVYVNVDAIPVQTAAAARDALVRQVSRAVRWEQTIARMLQDGVTLFVEIGPGKVLTGMIRRIDKDIERLNVEAPADFEPARAAIGRHSA